MKHSNKLPGIGAALGILVLILDGKTAITGAQEGIELCLRTVIPSLFPFFLLSIVLTSSVLGAPSHLLRPLQKLCRIPSGSEPILLTGFLGGYPVGAQSAANAYENGQLSKQAAERLLMFCNNAGPSFLFGIIGSQFPGMIFPWLLWGIHLLSAVEVSFLFPPVSSSPVMPAVSKSVTLPEALQKALTVMATVCGWVIVFRVILTFLNRWIFWLFPREFQVMLTGILELANGCCSLSKIDHVGLRFLCCAGMISFGGICVTLQTASVIGKLDIRYYLKGKLLQTFFSLVLASVCQFFFPMEVRVPVPMGFCGVGILSVCLIFALQRKNNSRNPAALGV